jgi:hypothetical protein
MKLLQTMLSVLFLFLLVSPGSAQTASTGALTGAITDPNGAVVPNVKVTITNEITGATLTVTSQSDGVYRAPLLLPGKYRVEAAGGGFKTATVSGVTIVVTETATLNIRLEVGGATESVTIESSQQLAQTENVTLGRVTTEREVKELPLVTRNYTQILGLSPGVIANVNNANELGRGSSGLSGAAGDVHAHGARAADNNFQMNGVQVNDLAGQGNTSGGVAIPNPDTIQEFKVQTALYDAAFGRGGGANVNVVTKSGSNQFHGNLLHFFRNRALNANDFFFNLAGQERPILNQNQFGGTLGGPIKKDRLLFFTSYQGTRQRNGASAGCSSSALLPPLTNDRSAAAIGALFAGRRGAFPTQFNVGPAILADGSNINPVALKLLQQKLPNGEYLIPTPQRIDPSRPFDTRGFAVFSQACSFNEDQGMINLDLPQSEKSRVATRYFIADSNQNQTMPGGSLPGFPQQNFQRFQNATVTHSYTINPHLFNEAIIGYHRVATRLRQQSAFSFSSVGSAVSSFYDDLPYFVLSGCCNLGSAASPIHNVQNNYSIRDALSWVKGRHNLRFGGGLSRLHYNMQEFRFVGQVQFPTFPDFLMGLNAANNGTGPAPVPDFSNIIASVDFIGFPDRSWRVWEADAYAQDDFKLFSRLTLNLGLRYERLGHLGEELGRNAVFDTRLANPTPPATGSLAGFVVASNYQGTVPAGVTQAKNDLAIDGAGQNRFGPRLGFAWQLLPRSSRFVLRGGYGIYYSRIVGQTFFQAITAPPFGQIRISTGPANAGASLQAPFGAPPSLSSFPNFRSYSPTTALSVITLAHDYQPPITQQWGLNLQTQFLSDFLWEVGYVGARGTKLIRTRELNQASSASATNPIRGVTTNTVANVRDRVPYQGFPAFNGIRQVESGGGSWYHGLETSLTKRFSKGLQFLASYTFARAFDSDGFAVETLAAGGTNNGDMNDWRQRYGPSNFNRDHRFVLSGIYELPTPGGFKNGLAGRLLSGWSLTGVVTIQSGRHLTLTGTNASNVFGITADRLQLAAGCTYDQLTTKGSVTSRLNNYFNAACIARSAPTAANPNGIATWPIIGNDNIGTTFGNSGVGIVTGPAQNNVDLALRKVTRITEAKNVEFRAEFFNAFNTPQFANPNTTFGNSYGLITATSVNPRVVQLALKLAF